MLVKHNASLIITGVVICLFVMFIVLAAFIRPSVDTGDLTGAEKTMVLNMAQMVWWMTIALIVLPIMLILILIAAYMFITADRTKEPKPAPAPAAQKSTFFGKSVSGTKVAEASSPNDALDLRYAKGELTRDQYMAIKADMKVNRL
jgi:di/tricarboxylate transporter